MKIKAIIFDLDDTLSDRTLCLKNFSDKFVENYSSYIKEPQSEHIVQQIKISDRNGYRNKEEMFQEILDVLPWENKPTISDLIEYRNREFVNCTVGMKGIEEVLKTFKVMGVKLGIITNGSISEQSKKIEKLNIRSYFDSIIISDAVSIKKPDPRIFQLSLDELGVNAEESIYVGDHPSNDVVGALDAGLDAIWLKGQEEWNIKYVIPNKIAISLEDLIDLVS